MTDDPYDGQEPTVPSDVGAEMATLGGMLLSAEAIADCIPLVRANDFYLPKHEHVYAAIAGQYAVGAPADVITIADVLSKRGQLLQVGGIEYLYSMTSHVPAAAVSGHYATIVAEKAVLRRLVEGGQRIVQMGRASQGEPMDLVDAARAEVEAAVSVSLSGLRTAGETFDAFARSLNEPNRFTPTCWYELNRVIGGWRPGGLYVIAARPGFGKTVLGLNVARHLAPVGPVGFVSIEMTEIELQARLVAQMASIDLQVIEKGSAALRDSDWHSVSAVRSALQEMPLFINDEISSLAEVQAFARSVHRRGNMQALVIDYLQIVALGRRTESRQQEVTEVSKALKRLAKDLGIPVIALAQVKREPTQQRKRPAYDPKSKTRVWRGPEMDDLRESGQIEQDADVVMLLHREEGSGLLDVKVGKNRHGVKKTFSLSWEGRFSRAVSMVRPSDQVPLDGTE